MRKELEVTRKELVANQSAAADANQRLQTTSGASKSIMETKEADMEGFRKRVVEMEKEAEAKEKRVIELQNKVAGLAAEVEEKELEIDFLLRQLNEAEAKIG